MSFANSTYTDILTTTIEARSGEIADNVTKNNAILARLKQKGNVRPFSGGSVIIEELSFAENQNAAWYSGADLLSVGASDNISASQWNIKQLACGVSMTGLEGLQNAGKQQTIDLMMGRMKVAEATMANRLAQGCYADGTTYGGKSLVGLGAGVIASPGTGVYGGIDPATWTFWQNQVVTGATSSTVIQAKMNSLWALMVRGKDRPDLAVFDANLWGYFTSTLQLLQRFTGTEQANLGFPSVKFFDMDVVLDGGIGGYISTNAGYFLNTDYLFLRPHTERNMVPLGKRSSPNQDVTSEIIAWAGAMTCSGRQFQGYLRGS